MTRIYWYATALLTITALISYVLHLNGFPPPWDLEKGESVSKVRVFLTTPFSLAITGAFLTLISVFSKRGRASDPGKAQNIAAMSILFFPILALGLQIVMTLLLYDVIEKNIAKFFIVGVAAVFFLTMGNYIVTVKPGSRVGFRNKWTLSDPIIWTRSHRLLGRGLVIGTLSILPFAVFVNSEFVVYALVFMAMGMKAITWLYARSLVQQSTLAKNIN